MNVLFLKGNLPSKRDFFQNANIKPESAAHQRNTKEKDSRGNEMVGQRKDLKGQGKAICTSVGPFCAA